MFFCNSLSLRARFLIVPIIGLILTLIIFFKSYVLINDHSDLLTDLHQTEMPRLAETINAVILLSQHNTKLRDLIAATSSDVGGEEMYVKGRDLLLEHQELEDYFDFWTQDSSHFVSQHVSKSDVDFLMGQIKASLGVYSGQVVAAIDFVASRSVYGSAGEHQNNHLENATEIIKDLNNIFMALSRLHAIKLKERSQALESAKKGQTTTTAISLLLMFLMLLSTFYFSQRLSKMMETINQAIISLASGDKNVALPKVKGRDLSKLVSALSVFQGVLLKEEKQKQELTLSQKRYCNVLNISPTAIITIDQDFNVILFNRAAELIYGFESDEVLGEPIFMLMAEDDKSDYQHRLEEFLTSDLKLSFNEGITGNGKRKNGDAFPMEVSLGKIEDGDVMLVTLSITDVTDRVNSEQEIRHQAHHDSLTGLPNRLLSLRRLREYMRDTVPAHEMVGVIFLDLDDFKKINDSMGHEAGDLLLIEAAKRLESILDGRGTVGRLGGDEFIILLNKLSSVSEADDIATQLVTRFREPFDIAGRQLVLTLSVGISFYPDDASTSSALLRNADSAMYQSKRAGRNTYTFFTHDMGEGDSRRLLIEEKMRGGLSRGEFSLNYQPKIDLRTNKVASVEALIRWNNDELGQVHPSEFIPIAEKSGLIIDIGQYVLIEAIGAIQQWSKSGHDVGIAINLSPRQFHDPDLVSFISSIVRGSQVNPALIELEITEGVLMSGHRFITEALESLNALGVKLAMDDFGTGFSSLSYLREYSFDTLKIDRSFITDLMVDEEDRTLVNAIIAMAHSLDLEVVAEGVETVEQLDYLKQQGCEYAQGFLRGKPMSFDDLGQALIEERQLLAADIIA